MQNIVGKYIKCDWCNKTYDTPGRLMRYDDKIFCGSDCLGEYLVEKVGEDIEDIWFDTPENIEMCAKEAKREW